MNKTGGQKQEKLQPCRRFVVVVSLVNEGDALLIALVHLDVVVNVVAVFGLLILPSFCLRLNAKFCFHSCQFEAKFLLLQQMESAERRSNLINMLQESFTTLTRVIQTM